MAARAWPSSPPNAGRPRRLRGSVAQPFEPLGWRRPFGLAFTTAAVHSCPRRLQARPSDDAWIAGCRRVATEIRSASSLPLAGGARVLLGEAPPALRAQQQVEGRGRLRMRAEQEVGVLQVLRPRTSLVSRKCVGMVRNVFSSAIVTTLLSTTPTTATAGAGSPFSFGALTSALTWSPGT